MSSPSLFSVYLSGASLVLLLTAGLEVPYENFTQIPDYDSDYNATFEYSFFSNTSIEDLDKLRDQYIGQDEEDEEQEEVTEGYLEDWTVTTVTPRQSTAVGGIDISNTASLPVSMATRTLMWTLTVVITQQLQRTL